MKVCTTRSYSPSAKTESDQVRIKFFFTRWRGDVPFWSELFRIVIAIGIA